MDEHDAREVLATLVARDDAVAAVLDILRGRAAAVQDRGAPPPHEAPTIDVTERATAARSGGLGTDLHTVLSGATTERSPSALFDSAASDGRRTEALRELLRSLFPAGALGTGSGADADELKVELTGSRASLGVVAGTLARVLAADDAGPGLEVRPAEGLVVWGGRDGRPQLVFALPHALEPHHVTLLGHLAALAQA